MRAKTLFSAALAAAFTVWLAAGCREKSADTAGGAKGQPAPEARKTLYWIQFLKGHPVHQLTQVAFQEGCRKLGYNSAVVGTDGADIGGTIALAEQVLAKGDAAGLAIWTGNPAYNSLIEKAGRSGLPVILPHFPAPEGSIPGATGIISCDPAAYASNAAAQIGRAIHGTGAVAVTQGSFNTTENLAARTFTETLKQEFPKTQILEPIEEGFDAPAAIAKAVSLLQAHPNLTAAFSTTGGGPVTWANAQRETGRKIIIVGMDYTRINLDLVKAGEVYAVIGQPLWEESFGAAELLDQALRKQKIPWWTKLPAPFITQDKLAPYYELLDKVEKTVQR